MWLPWDWALAFAAAAEIVAFVLLGTPRLPGSPVPRVRTPASGGRRAVGAFLRECGLVLVLYAIWNAVGRLSLMQPDGAMRRAEQIWWLERALWWPSERWLQEVVLPIGGLVQASNIYYAGAHVPGLGAVLIWAFLRHRDQYRQLRNTVAMVTAACLLLQFVPVAPPRMLEAAGMVDTGYLYGQSVYPPPRLGQPGPAVSHAVGARCLGGHRGMGNDGVHPLSMALARTGPRRAHGARRCRHRQPLLARRRRGRVPADRRARRSMDGGALASPRVGR